jgi:hypothetical protein
MMTRGGGEELEVGVEAASEQAARPVEPQSGSASS